MGSDAPKNTAPGWFGKIAPLGDFAQRRLPQHCMETCDAWLSAGMHAGQEQLRDRWVTAFLQAPILRFGWAPGVIDAQWWFGVLMPSCDNVGRYFPLLIAQPRRQAPEDRIALDHLELWLDHVAAAALQTLSDSGASVDAFEGLLQEAPPWPMAAQSASLTSSGGPDAEHWSSNGSVQLPLFRWLHPMAAAQISQRLAGHTLWWRVGHPGAATDSIDIVRGLPQGPRFVSLMEGGRPG